MSQSLYRSLGKGGDGGRGGSSGYEAGGNGGGGAYGYQCFSVAPGTVLNIVLDNTSTSVNDLISASNGQNGGTYSPVEQMALGELHLQHTTFLAKMRHQPKEDKGQMEVKAV